MIRDEKYWAVRLDENTPENVKRAIKRVYHAYDPEDLPQGTCDPLYIMNVITKELGVGDGMGNFNKYQDEIKDALNIINSYSHIPAIKSACLKLQNILNENEIDN